jgi:hypothetical protein
MPKGKSSQRRFDQQMVRIVQETISMASPIKPVDHMEEAGGKTLPF